MANNLPSTPWDPALAEGQASNPIAHGDVAAGNWPLLIDFLHVTGLYGIPPSHGVGCQLDTTAQELSFIAPPFADRVQFAVIAAGDANITIAVTAGGSGGPITINPSGDTASTGASFAILMLAGSDLTVTSGTTCREFKVEVSRASTNVQCYAIAPIWKRNSSAL